MKTLEITPDIDKKILEKASINPDKKVSDWNDNEIGRIRELVSEITIEGELRSGIQLNIKRLMDIGSYRGIRHRIGLPLRGQRTKNNSKTYITTLSNPFLANKN